MPQRRGGGNGSDNADSLLRRGLRELLDRVDRAEGVSGGGGGGNNNSSARARSNGGGGGSNGRDGRGRDESRNARGTSQGGTVGNGRLPQAGDWTCGNCHFAPNFSRRRTCFKCGRARSPRSNNLPTAGGGTGSLTKGPVGAGGLRPLLGSRANAVGGSGAATKAAEGPPTFRVPGASVAARAAAGGSSGTWASVASRPAPSNQGKAVGTNGQGNDEVGTAASQGAASSGLDADGFQEVVRRRSNKGGAGVAGTTGTRDDTRREEQARGTSVDRDGDRDAGANAGGEDDEEAGGQPTVADLQQFWHQEVALVKRLRSQGLDEQHPAMRAACEARDSAERAWRGAKEPAPISVRLGRAQTKLDRAVALQAEARAAMLAEERSHKERMATLQADLDECTDRVNLRRQQLQAVQGELGAQGPARTRTQQAQMQAIRKVHSTICAEVGPTIASLVEQLDSGAPAWTALNGLLGKLQESKQELENAAAEPETADRFDIGDQDHDQDDGHWDRGSEWSESHDVRGQHWGHGDAARAEPHDQRGGDDDETMGHHDYDADRGQHMGYRGYEHYDNWGCVPRQRGEGNQLRPTEAGEWWDTQARRWGGAVRWQAAGHSKWSRESWADQMEEEDADEDAAADPPPPARRRLEAANEQPTAGTDTQQQQQQHPIAPGAAAAGSTAGGEPADGPGMAAKKHTERINRIVTMAIEAGVTPLTAQGEELCLLDPAQLEAWVAQCLPSALLC